MLVMIISLIQCDFTLSDCFLNSGNISICFNYVIFKYILKFRALNIIILYFTIFLILSQKLYDFFLNL